MKRVATFFKATLLGGLFILVPVLLVFGAVIRVVSSVRGVVQGIMEKLAGPGSFADEFPLLIAILFILGMSFVLGVGMVSGKGRMVGSWFERTLLFRIPGYNALKVILSGFSSAEGEGGVRTGLLTLEDGIKCIVFVMEDHGDGWLTVFTPESPNPATGAVTFVRRELVQLLPLRIHEIGPRFHQWGIGMGKVLAKSGGLASLASENPER